MAVHQIESLLHDRHHIKPDQPDDFSIRDMTEMSKALGSTTETMTRSLLFVALVSLSSLSLLVLCATVAVFLYRMQTDTADVLVRAVRAVAAWGRHALIAQHCDLGDVASVENAFAAELSSGLDGGEELRRLLVRLYESGLATGLAAFQH